MARQDFHERRLAGAVLADHGVDFAGVQGHVRLVQRGQVAEVSDDLTHRQYLLRIGHVPRTELVCRLCA